MSQEEEEEEEEEEKEEKKKKDSEGRLTARTELQDQFNAEHWGRDGVRSFRDLFLDSLALAICLIVAAFLKFSKS